MSETMPFAKSAKDAKSLLAGAHDFEWLDTLVASLKGRKIVDVGYAIDTEEAMAWPVLILDDGTQVIINRDDEGNGPGVMRVYKNDEDSHIGSWTVYPKQDF